MEASRTRQAYLEPSKLTVGELGGCLSGLVLVGSMFLPWYSTSGNGRINGQAGEFNAFDTFSTLQWLLLAAATAPFILSWIVARGHKLTWAPGEVTMIVGITAFVLILCNGFILGRPGEPDSLITLEIGWFVGLLGSIGMAISGYLRQAFYTEGRKPPGVL
jgi:hypothetical protein